MNEKLLKPYNPNETEERIYKLWEESGFFNPDKLPSRHTTPFTIIMPPPNANGRLHAGHAVFITIEDLLIRYKRMRGFKTLWLPGADHAGFETQVVYEKKLEKEGRSRFGMDPKLLREEILAFTLAHKSSMENQLRQLGASCDWSREKFTLDSDIVRTVYDTFKKLYDDKLAYRGNRIVNWCTKHQTSLSDIETERVEQAGTLYYITYGPFTVATVRPETIFGDVAIAVNPNDARYTKYIGQTVTAKNPIGELSLPVIGDESVLMDFGTGALKITPAHDPNDFAIAERHNLPAVSVIDQFGKLNEKTGKYGGMKVLEAREAVAKDLEKMRLLVKTENYAHAVITCYKCNKTLEPRIMPQWFVKMRPLADRAIEKIAKDEIRFVPEHYKKICLAWLENIIDWNISRQIAWGIPIPAKLCEKCGAGIPDIDNAISVCPVCGGSVVADADTFDTWFSSGQWPFATLGYPDGADYRAYYPTDVMETAGEIIFFWVARMIMLGLYRTEKLPFHTVYLHGIITAKDGGKMSKSKGNVLDPIEISGKYGTDAFRMGLVIGNTPGTSSALYEEKIKGYKHFANKIWNASRFVIENTENIDTNKKTDLTKKDEEIINECASLIADITKDIDEYRLHLAAEKLYHYFWHTFADKIIEEAKAILKGPDDEAKKSCRYMLRYILTNSLKALHPFMPFITEEIWQLLPDTKGLLIVEEWPKK